MRPYLVTEPTEEPVSLAEAKAQCEVPLDDATRDGLLERLIVAARQSVEEYLNRKLCTQTWDFKCDAFPVDRLELSYAPTQSVTYVKYLDEDGTEQTWDSSTGYEVHGASAEPGAHDERAFIVPRHGQTWPIVQAMPEAVRVRAVMGYGDATTVPEGIKQAILLRVGELFAQREPVITGMNFIRTDTDKNLLRPFRSLRAA